ncbi:hypothetical protein BpHYR1_023003 [Brachionus plicatilis]|uniref:Uncharacterized protein n=1 Tax=Brachionus plicatilis TaxID=10195 RepID=A0A3M7QVV0_BRAPC|nr:hypothetical protein BpHYR1_023003 [Brachionus plicatilis]
MNISILIFRKLKYRANFKFDLRLIKIRLARSLGCLSSTFNACSITVPHRKESKAMDEWNFLDYTSKELICRQSKNLKKK